MIRHCAKDREVCSKKKIWWWRRRQSSSTWEGPKMPMRNATLKVLIYSFSRRRVFPRPAKIHSLVYGIGTSKTCGGQQNLFSKNFYFDFELNPSKGHDRECRKLKNVLLLYGKTNSFYLLEASKKHIKFWKERFALRRSYS